MLPIRSRNRRRALFDWIAIIARNRAALSRTLATVVAMVGGSGAVTRETHRAALALLRPAESAVRRLVQILAADLDPDPPARSAPPKGPIPKGTGKAARTPSFPLFDPRIDPEPPEKKVSGTGPWVRSLDGSDPPPPRPRAPLPDDPLDATRLRRRAAALAGALGDLPRQARRLARILARGHRWLRVMRPGNPPGHRTLPENSTRRREIDEVLADCQTAALWKLHLKAQGP